jgi:hypothetical protein
LPPEVDAAVFMQADLSEDAAEARLLLAPIEEGRADMVLGSRTQGTAEPGALLPHQEFGNWVATTLIRLLYRYRYTDLGPFAQFGWTLCDGLGCANATMGGRSKCRSGRWKKDSACWKSLCGTVSGSPESTRFPAT